MTDSYDDGQGADPYGRPPTGPADHPDPSVNQSSFPQPPQQPPPGQYPPPGQFPPPGQQPPSGQFPPPAQFPGQEPPHASPFEPPAQQPPYAGPAGYGAGPGQFPQPPAKKKRRIWPWLLLGIPLLFAVGIGACSWLVFGAVRGPIDATNNYVANLDNGDFGAAYDSLCAADRANYARDSWTAGVQESIGGDITGYSFTQVEISGDALVTGTIEIDGVSQTSVFRLVDEGDEWRICE